MKKDKITIKREDLEFIREILTDDFFISFGNIGSEHYQRIKKLVENLDISLGHEKT